MSEELKPCPFCGGKAFMWGRGEKIKVKVSCEKDCVTMPPRFDVFFTSIDEAVKRWNKRGFFIRGQMNLKKYTRVKTHKTESFPFYTIHLVVEHQSFELNYLVNKKEAEWMRGQLAKALENLIKLEGGK